MARGVYARRSAEERFWSRVRKTRSCWIWTGGTSKGYGRFWFEGRDIPAHVYAYELLVGPMPEDCEADHVCKNRACVRPSQNHVRPLAPSLNRGDSQRNRKVCPRGHRYTKTNTYVCKQGKRSCKKCMTESRKRSYERKRAQIG